MSANNGCPYKKICCLKSTIVIKICVCLNLVVLMKILGTVHTRKGPKIRTLVKLNS